MKLLPVPTITERQKKRRDYTPIAIVTALRLDAGLFGVTVAQVGNRHSFALRRELVGLQLLFSSVELKLPVLFCLDQRKELLARVLGAAEVDVAGAVENDQVSLLDGRVLQQAVDAGLPDLKGSGIVARSGGRNGKYMELVEKW